MSDITRPIEPFELTQEFGVNPQNYKQFGLAGHNGWDLKTRYPDTPQGRRDILSSWFSTFYKQGWDPTGYGNYFEVIVILKNIWKITYAHCHSIKPFNTIKEAQGMAISDNTGNSTGPHLHITVKKIKIVDGIHQVFNYDNGYFGAVNPQIFFDELRKYKNAGNNPVESGGIMVQVEDSVYKNLIVKCNNRDQLFDFLEVPRDPIEETIDRPRAVIEGYKNLATGLQRQLDTVKQETQNKIEELERNKQTWDESAKTTEANINALEKHNDALQKQVESLKGQLETHAKAEGTAKIEATQWKTKYDQAVASLVSSLPLLDILRSYVKNKIRKITNGKI